MQFVTYDTRPVGSPQASTEAHRAEAAPFRADNWRQLATLDFHRSELLCTSASTWETGAADGRYMSGRAKSFDKIGPGIIVRFSPSEPRRLRSEVSHVVEWLNVLVRPSIQAIWQPTN